MRIKLIAVIKKGVLIFVLFLFLIPQKTRAQEVSLSLWPPLLEATIKPGKSLTQVYKVANKGERGVYLTTTVVPFSAADRRGGVRFDLENKGTFFSGVAFSLANANLDLGETFLLLPGEEKELVLKITLSDKVEEKDYYFTFFLEQSSEGLFLTQGSRAMTKIGSHILLTASSSPQPEQHLSITQFEPVPKIGDNFGRVNFEVIISNPGKRYLKPVGEIIITDWRGKEGAKLELRPDNILAQSEREINCLTEDGRCSFHSYLPGLWRAKLVVHPDLWPERKVEKEVVFWLLPFRLVLALLIALAMVFLLLRYGERRKKSTFS